MDAGSIAAQTNAGVDPDYGTFWVGPWTLEHGWGGPDNQMASMRDQGVTPAIHFYYWGDDISQDCIENGCWSDLHDAQKDQAGWQRLADELVVHLDSQMQGEEVVIFIETEFNKADVQEYEPLDGYLAEKAQQIKAGYPNAHIVLSLGSWNTPAWQTWDRAAAASDAIGLQGMRGSTRDSETHYDNLYRDTLRNAQYAQSLFGQPIFLQDLALSTYPEPEYLQKQADGLQRFFDGMPDLKAAGVEAMVYRSWRDTQMDLNNYYGEAERHWGFAYGDGTYKPSAQVWIDGVLAERGDAAEPGPAPDFTAGFEPSPNNNEWWVEVRVSASSQPASVAASHDGGAWKTLPATSWGSHAKSFHAPAGGSMVFRATDGHGQTVMSDPYPWLHSETEQEPTNEPPVASFTASVDDLDVRLDASGSSDPDGDALSYAWDLGDGATASGVQVDHTYAEAGTYSVQLTADDGQATWSTSSDVRVERPNEAPMASFADAIDGLSVRLDASGSSDPDGDALSYAWDLGDGATASGVQVDHTYAEAGTYSVRLTVDDGQAQSQASRNVTVERPNTAPIASFTDTVDGLFVRLDASGSSDTDGDALSFVWSLGDGVTASGPQVDHTYAESGTYAVDLTVSDGQEQGQASRNVTVERPNRAPVASFEASLEGQQLAVDGSGSSDADGDALTFAWDFGDGGTASGATAGHPYAASGDYTVTLTVSDGSASSQATRSVTVEPTAFTASFTPSKNVNEWWVEVYVDGSSTPAKVEASHDGGRWQTLPATDWGSYAKSFHAPAGGSMVFRATDAHGQTAQVEVGWLGGSGLEAQFSPKAQDNRWWVEVDVTSDESIAKVEMRKDGGSWMPMDQKWWGSYAKSIDVGTNAEIEFRATADSGAQATSPVYLWNRG